jgi:3-methyladenine DNA glycosylase AlkD
MPASPLASTLLDRLDVAFGAARNDRRAEAMAAYMRDQFEFIGIPSPERVAIQRVVTDGLAQPEERDMEAFARSCWERPEREYQYVACDYLRKHVRRCSPSIIATVEHLVTTKPWWDTIDELSQNVVGPLVAAHADLRATMDRWIEADDFWLARAALLHQNRYRMRTHRDLLFSYCLRRSADREFFIRKAIGWALREYSKTDARATIEFVREHDTEFSGLTKTEALKWLRRQGRV